MPKLEVKNLQISFRTNNGAVRAVRDVSFNLEEGQTLAIVGESGSGKSVTARAIMGILAGNAMVDNGEIIYDGQDLLKISEDDFHTLRGNKLAMIFQDPLSALNPVMRIGRQLTEAMVLNNRERRRDGRRRFRKTTALLEKNAILAYQQEGSDKSAQIKAKISTFKRFIDRGVKLQTSYTASRDALVEAKDSIGELRLELKRGDERAAREVFSRLAKAAAAGHHPYLVPASDQAYHQLAESAAQNARSFHLRDSAAAQAMLGQLESAVDTALNREAPDFFAIAYGMEKGAQELPEGELAFINQMAGKQLNDGFMADFLVDVQKAMAYSAAHSLEAKKTALAALEEALPVFEKQPLVESECRAAFKSTAAAVDRSIDPMKLEKDNLAYVYRSSMKTNIDRYFRGLGANPKEEERFRRDTVKRQKLLDKNKAALQVVPMNLVDTDKARENLARDVRALSERYRHLLQNPAVPGVKEARALVDYLTRAAGDYGYKLSKAMAKHRSIELMDEVGIPEPYKRFRQFPFEFSGGMRQRIVIAIALSANPDILICDEPTTALDVTIQGQILELINDLKRQRNLSVIFITHDLGVVANMADSIAVMYAGKIVEYGTSEEVFYSPAHPYTWALLSSVPDLETKEKLEAIPGTPPNMIIPPKGDAFAARNHYALELDFEEQPPMFRITDTHYAATWLLHPDAPETKLPAIVQERIDRMHRRMKETTMEGRDAQ